MAQDPAPTASPPPRALPRTKRGKSTRERILRAAEEVFGARGFAAAGIADITRAAGIAQGTFYIYFDSKEDAFRELVAEMGRLTRKRLSDSVADAPDRLTAERMGLRAFLGLAVERPTLYNIVEEARFVDPDSYNAYFTTFARAYAKNLAAAVDEGEIRPGNAEIRAWALMGIAVTLGERFGLMDPAADRDAVVAEVFDMLENGLRPKPAARPATMAPDPAAQRAALTPEAVAFTDHGTAMTWTYAQVDHEAQRLAAHLTSMGLTAGDRLAALSLNRAEFFVALFAARKAGLILCPLNWRAPVAELAPIVARAGCRAIIHDAAHATMADAFGLPCIPMLETGGYGLPDAVFAAIPVEEDAPWLLLFTSGTTGAPKAVIQTPRMALACATNLAQAMGLTAADSTVNYLPLFHTAGINLFALPMFLWGGHCHILPRFDPDRLLSFIAEGLVTQFFGVPTIYQAFRAHPRIEGIDFRHLRGLACGGAALPADLIRFFADRGAVIRNGFGMTETGPTGFLIDADAALTRIGSVGKPQMMTEARLAGVPDGAPGTGELELRGATITPGYFGDPDATRAALTPDGWLRSGDIAERDADGYYRIVDRIKDMYISGGENVYPAEVERVLNGHPGVAEAAVVGIPDPRWGETGCAFIIPHPGETPDAAALQSWCRDHLAAFKVPSRFRLVADFPRTAAGKVRKPLLREQA
ncbi:MAG: AMP-binding protein [Gemmobacter sp.]|nr:AMP-binding protein [Gemmobacter sp.]